MDQKIQFINEWKSGAFTFQSLCEQFGISRALGYRLCRRYEAEKEKGLSLGRKLLSRFTTKP